MEGYREALKHAPQYLEMDLVASRDGHLVLRHDLLLDNTTNILELAQHGHAFSGRRTARIVEPDRAWMEGFFATDFTLAELKELSMRQSMPFRDHKWDDRSLRIVTIAEMLALVPELRAAGGQSGLYIEMKHPWYHAQMGFDMVDMLLEAIKAAGVSAADAAELLVVQCFDYQALERFSKAMARQGLDIPLVWLINCNSPRPNATQLQQLSALASRTAIGPDTAQLLLPVGTEECAMPEGDVCTGQGRTTGLFCDGRLPPGGLPRSSVLWVEQARALGVAVHAYTVRNENRFMALDFRGSVLDEMRALLDAQTGLNVDGVFVDCPSTALLYRSLGDRGTSRAARDRLGWELPVIMLSVPIGLGLAAWGACCVRTRSAACGLQLGAVRDGEAQMGEGAGAQDILQLADRAPLVAGNMSDSVEWGKDDTPTLS